LPLEFTQIATETKTEAPTPRRRQKARERAEVARSQNLTSVLCLVGVLAALNFAGSRLSRTALAMMTEALSDPAPMGFTVAGVMVAFRHWLQLGLALLAPLLTAAVVAAVLVNLAQTRFVFSAYSLQPRLQRISPTHGFQRLVSLRSLVRGLVSTFQVALILLVAGLVVRAHLPLLISAVNSSLIGAVMTGIHIATQIAIRCSLAMVVVGAADYGYEYYEHEKTLRMSRHELRQELRETEGEPLIAARRRRRRQELLQGTISAEMPDATAVVTNPTEIAVALRYDESLTAPKVVAKGRGVLAQRVIQLARIYNISIERNPPLAQSLYRMVPVGELVPEALYQAVAEILAIIYRKRAERQRRRPA